MKKINWKVALLSGWTFILGLAAGTAAEYRFLIVDRLKPDSDLDCEYYFEYSDSFAYRTWEPAIKYQMHVTVNTKSGSISFRPNYYSEDSKVESLIYERHLERTAALSPDRIKEFEKLVSRADKVSISEYNEDGIKVNGIPSNSNLTVNTWNYDTGYTDCRYYSLSDQNIEFLRQWAYNIYQKL